MALAYPQGTNELYEHLGAAVSKSDGVFLAPSANDKTAANDDKRLPQKSVQKSEEHFFGHDLQTNTYIINLSRFPLKKIFSAVWPYALTFLISLFFYFVFFTKTPILSIFASSQPAVQTQNLPIPDSQKAEYQEWIASYFYDVSDPSILDPNADLSGNGLTNYQKFLLGLNPTKTSTIGLNVSDTQALIMGIDPLSGNPLTDREKNIIQNNIDLEALANKLSLNAANTAVQNASSNTNDNAGIILNTDVPGRVDIPSLHISAPLIWTKSTADFENDLPNGLTHYPGTPMPGEIGTSYISGHSSNYPWIKGDYNNIFAHLDQLKMYDSFSISAQNTQGKTVVFHYVVRGSGIFKDDDQKQFANIGKSTVGLSTCWPVGTSANRLVIFGELTQVENN